MRFALTKLMCGITLLLTLAMLGVSFASAQSEEGHEPILVDEFGRVGECDFGGRLDNFLAELSAHPNQHGYIINYKPSDELPGAKDVYGRERQIANHITFRNFDSARITQIRGGYSEDHRTQLYRVPQGIAPPEPSGTVPEPKIADEKTLLYDKSWLGLYGGLGHGDMGGVDMDEFVLESVKAREAAEQAAQEAESAAEQENAEPNPDSTDEEPSASQESSDEPDDEGEAHHEEQPTEEELLAQRFEWTEVGLVEFMGSRKNSSGVLIFYADDQHFDIAKLRAFVEQGRDRIAERDKIAAGRLRVEFGGYRDSPEVEFWFVPAKGKPPVPKPAERKPVEEENE